MHGKVSRGKNNKVKRRRSGYASDAPVDVVARKFRHKICQSGKILAK
jgi:hypothetical protein